MQLATILAFVVASAVISIVPGPDMMFIIAHGIARGRLAGVVAALGMSSGIVVHTLAATLGLGALLAAAPMVLEIIRIVGAMFLIYLAITTVRSSKRTGREEVKVDRVRSLRKTYVMAMLTNLSNPKVIFFYLALFPQFVTPDSAWPTAVQFLVLGAILVTVGLAVDGSVALASGTLSVMLRRRPAVQSWLNRISAAIFGALAVRLVVDQS